MIKFLAFCEVHSRTAECEP